MEETEITVQVYGSLDEINSSLAKSGFNLAEKYILDDYYFTHLKKEQVQKASYRELILSSFVLRKVVGKTPRTFLEFKNKSQDDAGNVIAEQKVICDVADFKLAKEIFERSGLNMYCHLVDHCNIYSNGSFSFNLQVVDELGIFIEIEEFGQIKNLAPKQKFEELKRLVQQLGLRTGNDYSVKKVYEKIHR